MHERYSPSMRGVYPHLTRICCTLKILHLPILLSLHSLRSYKWWFDDANSSASIRASWCKKDFTQDHSGLPMKIWREEHFCPRDFWVALATVVRLLIRNERMYRQYFRAKSPLSFDKQYRAASLRNRLVLYLTAIRRIHCCQRMVLSINVSCQALLWKAVSWRETTDLCFVTIGHSGRLKVAV